MDPFLQVSFDVIKHYFCLLFDILRDEERIQVDVRVVQRSLIVLRSLYLAVQIKRSVVRYFAGFSESDFWARVQAKCLLI